MASEPPTAAGAVVMAFGIFCAAALTRLPEGAALAGPAAALVSALWLAIAGLFAASVWRHGLACRVDPVLGSFAVGTWVAGTAVAARVLMLATPADPWPARLAFALSLVLWLWFMPRAVRNLLRLVRAPSRPDGTILLATVATQAVALMALRLFPAAPAVRDAAAALMALGAGCYILAAPLVLRAFARGGPSLATHWRNGNCILHGALSITGLAAVVSGWFPADALFAYWSAVLAVFAMVELVEIARLAARVRAFGWRQGIFVYDVSQWARNFTFGMLYAFTLAFAQGFPLADHPRLEGLRAFVVAFGGYAVLVFLLLEAALMVAARRDPAGQAS
jgi:hypothetical protein